MKDAMEKDEHCQHPTMKIPYQKTRICFLVVSDSFSNELRRALKTATGRCGRE